MRYLPRPIGQRSRTWDMTLMYSFTRPLILDTAPLPSALTSLLEKTSLRVAEPSETPSALTALALASPSWMARAIDLSRSAFMAERRVRMFLRSPAAAFFQDIATPVIRSRFFSNLPALDTTALVRVLRREENIFLAPAMPAAAEAWAAPSLAPRAELAAVCAVSPEAMAP